MASTSVVFDILARDRASGAFDKVAGSADKSSSKLSRFAGAAKKAGKVAALGLLAVGTGAVAAGKYVFNYGAKLEQMAMKAETVFGGQLGSVEKWADKNAHAMGLTTREATGLAANFADLLIPMGFTRKAAAGMSTDVVGLSGALSQWSGGTVSASEASDILAKAMLGERDGLKALGISISEADVKAQLLKTGQDKLTGAALQQAEAQATQTLIMAKSTDAQAAFAAGGSPLLSMQAKLKATFGEVRDELVSRLVPVLTDMGEWFMTTGLPAVKGLAAQFKTDLLPVLKDIGVVLLDVGQKVVDIAQFFNRHRTATMFLVGALGALVVVTQVHAAVLAVTAAGGMAAWLKGTKVITAATKTWAAVQWVLNAALTANPIGIVVVALAALAAGVVIAYKRSETFRRIVQGAFSAVKVAASAVLGFFKSHWPKILVILTGPVGLATVAIIKNWDKIKGAGQAVVSWVKGIPGQLRALADNFGSAGRALIGAFVDGMKNAAGIVAGIAGNVWNTVKGLLNSAIDKINAALEFEISLPGPNITINPPNIPHLAKGGIVTRPTLALIGEAGPEAVVPLSGPSAPRAGRGGGGITVNINGALDPVAVGRQVEQVLVKYARSTGRPLQVRTI